MVCELLPECSLRVWWRRAVAATKLINLHYYGVPNVVVNPAESSIIEFYRSVDEKN